MARRAITNGNDAGALGEHVKLENRLLLVAWLNSLLGYKNNREMLRDVKEAREGFDHAGRSFISQRIASRRDDVSIPLDVLGGYDENIRAHLAAINARRREPITLRYFQHLAVLCAEICLDWFFNRPGEMLRRLNEFVDKRNTKGYREGWPSEEPFAAEDLAKLAFWMATGAGKTLIMHINYHQFLRYNRRPLDNILLITPNEGLSEQHIEEMSASSVPCARFNLDESGLGFAQRHVVRVIEVTKLVQEKRGGGLSVPVEAFEGNNLILVDEGHKGSGGKAWRGFREALGRTGFTFEYSATFGQALTAARDDALTAEYGKAIAFDYSYKYFHGDGHGKDFDILNLREERAEEQTDALLLGNLLSFYEQQRCFTEQADSLRPYNLDKPLWVFVGSSVNAVYRESGKPRSDVLTVARFLHRFLENKRDWAVKTIDRLLDGESGLEDDHGQDAFAARLKYLRASKRGADRVYRDILRSVFNSPSGGGLHVCDIRGSAGELGLKAGEAKDYFGLIYIGDTASFKKLVEGDDSGIVLEEDAVSASLFADINQPDTSVNILIGAKKFMEGWNSWRVSNMGLLNIGRTEGSEIIQLFGRGVRLRGLGVSLKRSGALDGHHPPDIGLLETLNIFAVRANYMAQFREYLEREGVEPLGHVVLPLAIRPNKEFLGKGLVAPRVPADRNFALECDVVLGLDDAARVSLDLSLKVESLRSAATGLKTASMKAGEERPIPPGSLDLVRWDRVYLDLLEYKQQKGFANLVIQADAPRKILAASEPRLYRLVADEAAVRPRSFSEARVLQETVLTILRRYVERFYYVAKARWESQHMIYEALSSDHANFQDYTIRIPRADHELVEAVKKLLAEGERIYREEVHDLPNIHFDRHLYQPLLVERGDRIKTKPPGLKDSEQRFVKDLRDYVRDQADKDLAGRQVFLLRNLSRDKGIGFFEKEGFYPDFILWIKQGDAQRIVFVEPHGMRQDKAYWASDKARLHERLRDLSKTWGEKAGLKGVVLDSFIISATPYDELRSMWTEGPMSREDFAKRHILFQDDPGGGSFRELRHVFSENGIE
ncbi:MAG: DEAD/DEAH box helicase family protein [Planctomycetes bacterium]|nr:DEAD/DEAH box helicase family protein [Planctomycetota bacterium]